MVNFIEPNFQDIIFTLSTVSLITQKQFKKLTFFGLDPLMIPTSYGTFSTCQDFIVAYGIVSFTRTF